MKYPWIKCVCVLVGWMLCSHASAQFICRIQAATGIEFGLYHPPDNQPLNGSGAFRLHCRNATGGARNASVCLGLRAGGAGSSISNRRMNGDTGGYLRYQLYKDSGRTQIWGAVTAAGEHLTWQQQVPPGDHYYEIPVYGRILAGLTSTIAGQYASGYPFPGQIELAFADVDFHDPYPSCLGLPFEQADSVGFSVTATVENKCDITAPTELDFGTVNGVNVPALKGGFKMSVRCTRGAQYTIALDDGQFSPSPGQRQMRRVGSPVAYIHYEIYQDSGMNTRWGSTASGVTGVTVGPVVAQNPQYHSYAGYGLVPAQTATATGTYQDRVIVTVMW